MFKQLQDRASALYLKAGVATALVLAAVPSFAVDPFDTAITDASAKITTYATALVGVSAIAVVFMIAMKYVKRIPRAS